MSEDFHNTSTILTTFSVSVYVLGYAIGPLFLSPLSEMYGRQIILNIATIHFVLWQIGCALAPNISALIVFRLLSGMGGSACLTLGGGAIADMFEKENRGKAMSIFTFGPLFGPVLGPVAGGFIAQQVGWRWVFWTLLIAAGSCTAVILILYRETNPTILIRRKTHRLGQQLSRTDLRSCYEVTSAARSPASIMIFALARPLRMLCRSPVIGPLAIYLALIYGCLYLLFTTVTLVFQKTYHWTPDLAGLSYLGLGLGTMCGQILFGLTSDRLLLKLVSRNNGVYQPEMRLSMCLLYACFVPVSFFWYGWSIQAQVHWILPIIGLWPFGFGMIGIFMSIQTYVVDAYPMFAASGIAAITVTRSFFGAFLPLVGPPVFDTLGYGWGNSLLGFITLALVPIPVLFQRGRSNAQEVIHATLARPPLMCQYAEPSRKRRKRVRAIEQFEALESRLSQMEACIATATGKPMAGSSRFAKSSGRSRSSSPVPQRGLKSAAVSAPSSTSKLALTRHATQDGEAEYQGYSADRSFLQRMREVGNWAGAEIHRKLRRSEGQLPRLFEPDYGLAATAYLPSKERSRTLIDAALDAYSLLPILHMPTFDSSWNIVYSIEPSHYSAEDYRFLPLLYAVLALGCLFNQSDGQRTSRDSAKAEGVRLFAASRCSIDLNHCTDETTLQAVVFLNLFLLEIARAGTCYSYLTHALTLTLRMGLHRSFPGSRDLIRSEVRRRVFWTTRLLTNYLAALTGMPILLDDNNVDQDQAGEVNDIYITKVEILPQPANEICQFSGMNAYIRLHNILRDVLKSIYPLRGISRNPGKEPVGYLVNTEKVTAIEEALRNWTETLPVGFRLGIDMSPRSLLRSQYLLAMSQLHVQVYLYRPFLHYLSKSSESKSGVISGIGFSSYAAACLKACQRIIRLAGEVCRLDLVQGCNVTFSHMVFTSIISLLYVLLGSSGWDEKEVAIVVEDIALGSRVLEIVSLYNEGMETGQKIVAAMIASLPKELADVRARLQKNGDVEVPSDPVDIAVATPAFCRTTHNEPLEFLEAQPFHLDNYGFSESTWNSMGMAPFPEWQAAFGTDRLNSTLGTGVEDVFNSIWPNDMDGLPFQ
ncbi:hypothetical protein H2200_006860 [Cladophialophora chaetospira]|uniref:Major facilitator superfamily (MFS) profile domain-containing protein n=1 Tax=Cladophialophora chaetospira TaxID=386627 RepID=A0AA39CI98_9EURO|nr:hypothetical protein H2200_006860 [Cladophialophora chaetospira]